MDLYFSTTEEGRAKEKIIKDILTVAYSARSMVGDIIVIDAAGASGNIFLAAYMAQALTANTVVFGYGVAELYTDVSSYYENYYKQPQAGVTVSKQFQAW